MATVMGHADSTGYQDDREQIGGRMLSYSKLAKEISSVRGAGGDQGFIFLGGCSVGNRHIPAALAKDFDTSVISTTGYVFRRESEFGDITLYSNSDANGRGSAGWFHVTSPDGTKSKKIESIP